MSARREFDKVKALSDMPVEKRAEWLSSAECAIEFLKENALSDHVVLYASLPHVLIHSVLVPLSAVDPPDQEDLEHMSVDVGNSWIIQRSYGGGEGHRVYLEPPLSFPGCKSLVGGEKLIFKRHFEGMRNYKAPIELSQKLVHCFGLHYLAERHAYCRLDDRGDLEDVITVLSGRSYNVVLMACKDLAEYMALSQQALVRKFDFTRFVLNNFSGWANQEPLRCSAPDLFYHVAVMSGHASYVNGCQIIRSSVTAEAIVAEWKRSLDPSNNRYETFKIQDWKNNRLIECSCAPDAISNYFTKSDKPFEVSPAFFRPEVLSKYKADPEKYMLKDRSISCRNSWYLKTYDINEAGQVHTYIVYLSQLPYEEQQYWKSFNEWPKEPISKRAFQTDFEGTWATEHNPLQDIKQVIHELDCRGPRWWNLRGGELSGAVLYPATNSAKEWGNELLALDQLIVEGFVAKELRILAKRLGTGLEKDWGSLKIIEAMLPSLGIPADEAASTIDPLRTLHNLRTKVKGHAAGGERHALEVSAKTEHLTYRAHFEALSRGCHTALVKVVDALDSVDNV
jgi:hypothetical protein